MKCLAESGAFKLVRQDAQQVEVAARSHHLGGLMQQLNFAGRICDAAVLFVGRSGRKDNVGHLRGFRQKQLVNDQQPQVSATRAGFPEMREWIRSNHIQSLELSGLRRFDHLRRRHTRLCGNLRAPMLRQGFRNRFVVQIRVTGQAVRQHSHIRSSARVRIIAQRHVTNFPRQLRPKRDNIFNRLASKLRPEHDGNFRLRFQRGLQRS